MFQFLSSHYVSTKNESIFFMFVKRCLSLLATFKIFPKQEKEDEEGGGGRGGNEEE